MGRNCVRILAATVGAGALVSVTTGIASAWPIPVTGEQQNFINQAHQAGFPGDDDQVLMAGEQACRLLYTRQGTQAATDAIAGQYGAAPDQAAALVRSAHGILCTQAPG